MKIVKKKQKIYIYNFIDLNVLYRKKCKTPLLIFDASEFWIFDEQFLDENKYILSAYIEYK